MTDVYWAAVRRRLGRVAEAALGVRPPARSPSRAMEAAIAAEMPRIQEALRGLTLGDWGTRHLPVRTVQPNCSHTWPPCDQGCPNWKDPAMSEPLDPAVLEAEAEHDVQQETVEREVRTMAVPSYTLEAVREHLTTLETETPDGLRIRVEIALPEGADEYRRRRAGAAVRMAEHQARAHLDGFLSD